MVDLNIIFMQVEYFLNMQRKRGEKSWRKNFKIFARQWKKFHCSIWLEKFFFFFFWGEWLWCKSIIIQCNKKSLTNLFAHLMHLSFFFADRYFVFLFYFSGLILNFEIVLLCYLMNHKIKKKNKIKKYIKLIW